MAIKEWIYKSTDGSEKSLIKRLLSSRGVYSEEEIFEFTHPLEMKLTSPDAFVDMQKCVLRIAEAIDKQQKIVIYGDFDADGVTSTSLLYKTLSNLGAQVYYFIPDRESDGHGFNSKALVGVMRDFKPKLIISVDCGISNVDEIKFINSFGIDVIITDHHEAPDILPEAFGIINPKAQNSLDESLTAKQILSLSSLAGVGVAFKLAQALLIRFDKADFIPEILPFVAVGTVADVVPLIGENRYFVTKGLDLISRGKHYGLKRLLESAGYSLEKGISSETIAFGLAPRINASGRLETVESALKVLMSDNHQEIEMAIQTLNELNKVRQTLCQNIFEQADDMVQKEGNRNPAIILFNPEWQVGIIGIVASKLVEKYYKPTFLMTYSEETKQIKCSARSIEGVHLYETISAIGELLDGYGGHSLAAGLSFNPDKTPFKMVKEQLNRVIKEIVNGKELKPFINIDLEINPEDISVDLVKDLSVMEPFGASNPSPIFSMCDCVLKKKMFLGEGEKHIKLIVENGSKEFTCIRWQEGDISINSGAKLDLAFHPRLNTFNGFTDVQLIIDDIHSPELKEEVIEIEPAIKIYDHRKKSGILQQVNDYIKTAKQNIKIYALSKRTKDILSQYKTIFDNIFSDSSLTKCDAIMFFDYPADRETFENIIRSTNPKAVHFMNYDIKSYDNKELLKLITGMLKYSVNNNNGIVDLSRCAGFLGKSVTAVKCLFEVMSDSNIFDIVNRSDAEYSIQNFKAENALSVIQNPKFEEFLSVSEECELFQRSLLEDDVSALARLCEI